jgi:hypothetical protein
MRYIKFILISFFSFFLLSCSTIYRQQNIEGKLRSELAVIELTSCGDRCPIIEEIDGVWRGIGMFKEFEIKPGQREVKLAFVKGLISGKNGLVVSFEAKQGKVYSVRSNADLSLMKWSPVIIDKSTGELVSKIVSEELILNSF